MGYIILLFIYCSFIIWYIVLLSFFFINPPNSLENNKCENPRSATSGSSNNQASWRFSPDQLLFSWSFTFMVTRQFSTTFLKLVWTAVSFLFITSMKFWSISIIRNCGPSKNTFVHFCVWNIRTFLQWIFETFAVFV